jgi:hypothetical protein
MRLIYDSAKDNGGAETTLTMTATNLVNGGATATYAFALDSFPLGVQGYRPDAIAVIVNSSTDFVGAGTFVVDVSQNYNDASRASIIDSTAQATGQGGDQLAQQSGQTPITLKSGAGSAGVALEFFRVAGNSPGMGFTGDELLFLFSQTAFTAGVANLYIRLFTFGGV